MKKLGTHRCSLQQLLKESANGLMFFVIEMMTTGRGRSMISAGSCGAMEAHQTSDLRVAGSSPVGYDSSFFPDTTGPSSNHDWHHALFF